MLSALGMENSCVVMDTVFIGAFILTVDIAAYSHACVGKNP